MNILFLFQDLETLEKGIPPSRSTLLASYWCRIYKVVPLCLNNYLSSRTVRRLMPALDNQPRSKNKPSTEVLLRLREQETAERFAAEVETPTTLPWLSVMYTWLIRSSVFTLQ